MCQALECLQVECIHTHTPLTGCLKTLRVHVSLRNDAFLAFPLPGFGEHPLLSHHTVVLKYKYPVDEKERFPPV